MTCKEIDICETFAINLRTPVAGDGRANEREKPLIMVHTFDTFGHILMNTHFQHKSGIFEYKQKLNVLLNYETTIARDMCVVYFEMVGSKMKRFCTIAMSYQNNNQFNA